MEELKEKINKIIPLSHENLYYKNKLILSAKTNPKLEKEIEEKIKKPKKNIEVFVLRPSLMKDPRNKEVNLIISCSKYIITPELELKSVLGYFKSIEYTPKDLQKFGFKKSHINKIIKTVKKRLVSFRNISSSITDVLDATK